MRELSPDSRDVLGHRVKPLGDPGNHVPPDFGPQTHVAHPHAHDLMRAPRELPPESRGHVASLVTFSYKPQPAGLPLTSPRLRWPVPGPLHTRGQGQDHRRCVAEHAAAAPIDFGRNVVPIDFGRDAQHIDFGRDVVPIDFWQECCTH